ncbi:MAG TPA: DUF1553 domain-containing protein [Bryobacteraceae bacterium]|nr:DUF1553 domain-containing protein [Bryobacteraceae bacterium]
MNVSTVTVYGVIGFVLLVSASPRLLAQEEEVEAQPIPPEQGCTFKADPSQFLNAQSRAHEAIHRRLMEFPRGKAEAARAATADAVAIPHRNFIDKHILGKLEEMNIRPARLSSDEEFIRRVYLDVIGRIPSAQAVKNFVASTDTNKRTNLVESLILAPEFNDKWAVWFQDLIGMTENPSTNNRRPRVEGRNSFDRWIREKMQHNASMTSIVTTVLTGTGNNFFTENGPANYTVLGSVSMGPLQDSYDMMTVRSTTAFLGLGHYDCLMCHNGRGHLDQLSSWATKTTRADAHRMAAHFSRVRFNPVREAVQFEHPLFNSSVVVDNPTGTYDLNTTFGNRPNRTPYGTERNLTPEYRDRTKATGNWRDAFAQKLTTDPLFGLNFANRIWKEFFGLALVDPVDTLDPDRLDPSKPPPAPWTLQATNPQLLQDLATFFVQNDTNLREFIKLLVLSSSYQLSSEYEGEWKAEYVPLFARHYPRRMWAEEVHDAIVQATGVMPQYSWLLVHGETVARGTATNALPKSDPVSWAMKMPDVSEPRFLNGTQNGGATTFMNTFNRGNRDTARRASTGSILQQLSLMNDNSVVLPKIRLAASPNLREIAKLTDNNALVDEIWLTFLSRRPTPIERSKAVAHLQKTTPRNTAIEDLAWTAINKVDFLFSY